jgi:hypothetical protein
MYAAFGKVNASQFLTCLQGSRSTKDIKIRDVRAILRIEGTFHAISIHHQLKLVGISGLLFISDFPSNHM